MVVVDGEVFVVVRTVVLSVVGMVGIVLLWKTAGVLDSVLLRTAALEVLVGTCDDM